MSSPEPRPPEAVGALEVAQLTGFHVVLTSNRRSDELAGSLARRGATVTQAPVMRIVPLEEDTELLATTRAVIAEAPDDVVVTTAIGFRGWVDAADAADLAPLLLERLSRARILVRGPKARGAVRAAGLREAYCAPGETTTEVIEHLLAGGAQGRRVVVQLHGVTDDALLERLRTAGAAIRTVPVYRWGDSPDPEAVRRAIDAVAAGTADALVFTSAPGSEAFLEAARRAGRYDEVIDALSSRVVPTAVGDVTAGPLRAAGLDPLVPDRWRLGALVRTLGEHLGHRVVDIATPAGMLRLRGQQASLDGTALSLSPTLMTLLRLLAQDPGRVVERQRLLEALPGATDLHTVEVAVGRLRSALGRSDLVQTVVKRGYRLAVADV